MGGGRVKVGSVPSNTSVSRVHRSAGRVRSASRYSKIARSWQRLQFAGQVGEETVLEGVSRAPRDVELFPA